MIKEALERRDPMLINALFTFGRPFGIAQEANYLNILPSNLLAQLLLMYDLAKPQEQKSSTAQEHKCNKCGKTEDLSRCSRCKQVRYCSRNCQLNDWACHKLSCKPA